MIWLWVAGGFAVSLQIILAPDLVAVKVTPRFHSPTAAIFRFNLNRN
jgi:hypothetical protein